MLGVAPRTGGDLYAAARANDAIAMKKCLAVDDCDINHRAPPDSWTALIRASHDGHTPLVKMLLDAQADPNAASSLGRTALHVAAHGNHLPTVRLLLDAKADVDFLDIYDRTPLELAESYGNEGELVELLREGTREVTGSVRRRRAARKVAVGIVASEEMKAAGSGRHQALRRLVAAPHALYGELETPREPGARDEDGGAALALSQMLEKQLEEDEEQELDSDDEEREEGLRNQIRKEAGKRRGAAQIFASAFGKHKALKALIEAGCNVNASDKKFNGNTPLHWAVLHKKLTSVEVLLQAGADPTKPNRDGMTPLDIARDMSLTQAVAWMEQTPQGQAEAAQRVAEEEAFAGRVIVRKTQGLALGAPSAAPAPGPDPVIERRVRY